MRVAIVVGTRPEIIKMSPVIQACQNQGVDFALIDTKQHYSDNMSGSFFRELHLPPPDYELDTVTGSHGRQISSMLVQFEEIFQKNPFDVVLVQGDTNSVVSGALMASRSNIPVGHVEAGLRSRDRTMPEEVNRVMVDHLAEYLFAASDDSLHNLYSEGIPQSQAWNTGNTIVDATLAHLELVQTLPLMKEQRRLKNYILLTTHRPANVDNPHTLRDILGGVKATMKAFHMPVIFPIHPRTRRNIESFGIGLPRGMKLVEPQGYLEFLQLQSQASLIMTDSGGIQEEACILKVPCVTLRNNTERPETVEVGANVLGGTTASRILAAAHRILRRRREWSIPYGDGRAGKQIVDLILHRHPDTNKTSTTNVTITAA